LLRDGSHPVGPARISASARRARPATRSRAHGAVTSPGAAGPSRHRRPAL